MHASLDRACRDTDAGGEVCCLSSVCCYWRPVGVLLVTPNEADFAPTVASANPSAASPRLSSSRTADALLGMRFLKRKSSRATNSASSSMICRRWARSLFAWAIAHFSMRQYR